MEPENRARTIQRVIDDKYPNTRLIWQSFQATTPKPLNPQYNPQTFSRSLPGSAAQSRPAPASAALDKVVQRVINLHYPETRGIWIQSRQEPAYLQTSAQRWRSYGPPPLGENDPRKGAPRRPKTGTS
jgi:hypothetical protein